MLPVGTCGVKHVLKKECLRWLIGTTFRTELIHRVYDCHVLIMIRWNVTIVILQVIYWQG